MRVTNTGGATAVTRTRETKRAGTAKKVAPEAIVDRISISGIPEAELTPRVRKALFSLLEEVGQLRAELAETRSQMNDLQTLADTDALLGVFNRRAFVRELDRALALVQRYQTPASLVFIDLNDLKIINDKLGHAAGDEALSHVASTVAENIRATDIFGRLGGDEFGLILMMTEEDTAQEKAESLRAAVRDAPLRLAGADRRLGIACGVVPLRSKTTAEEALGEADAKMYERKKVIKAARKKQGK